MLFRSFFDMARAGAAGDGRPAGLELPYIPVQDSPTPAGNAVAVMVLDRLAVITDEPRYGQAAEKALRACAPGNSAHGLFTASLFYALDLHLHPPLHVVIAGPGDDPRVRVLHRTALATYRPGTIVHLHDPAAPAGRLPQVIAPADARDDTPQAFVCGPAACAPPATTPEALRETMLSFDRVLAV